jgi:hypothetical protein
MAGETGRLIAIAFGGLLLVAAGPSKPNPASMLAGRYSQHYRNGMVDGSTYWSDDVLEIVPVDHDHAFVRVHTMFFNGHSCQLFGIARVEGNALVYREPPEEGVTPSCVLTLSRKGKLLSFDDGDASCKLHCGMRGTLSGSTLPWASRRPITYIARLKTSWEYREALSVWRTGKSMP